MFILCISMSPLGPLRSFGNFSLVVQFVSRVEPRLLCSELPVGHTGCLTQRAQLTVLLFDFTNAFNN